MLNLRYQAKNDRRGDSSQAEYHDSLPPRPQIPSSESEEEEDRESDDCEDQARDLGKELISSAFIIADRTSITHEVHQIPSGEVLTHEEYSGIGHVYYDDMQADQGSKPDHTCAGKCWVSTTIVRPVDRPSCKSSLTTEVAVN